jgi:biopolymer transport protein ExbB
MFDLLFKGGPVMILLVACSFFGLYTIIQKILFFKIHFSDTNETIKTIKEDLLTNGIEITLNSLRPDRKIVSKVLGNAIKLHDQPREKIQDGIRESIYNQIPKIDHLMPLLSSIISAAPILGLTGTVIGLMDIFNVISGGAIGDAQALSSGISTALITTVTGLLISVPLIFCYQYFNQKIEHFILDLERMSYEMIQFCQKNDFIQK